MYIGLKTLIESIKWAVSFQLKEFLFKDQNPSGEDVRMAIGISLFLLGISLFLVWWMVYIVPTNAEIFAAAAVHESGVLIRLENTRNLSDCMRMLDELSFILEKYDFDIDRVRESVEVTDCSDLR